jgi:hypothetical protein
MVIGRQALMATIDDINSTLQNIAKQLGYAAQSQQNAWPNQTAATSPISTPINTLSTTASVVIAASTTRHGLMFHNPGTASVYVYPTLASTAPTTTTVGGSFLILPGGTLEFAPALYPNVNCGWSAFSGTGSAQALTVVEFF